MNNPAIAENFESEDDTERCVDFMRPRVQAYLDYAFLKHGEDSEGIAWALHWGFADTLAQFTGHNRTTLKRSAAMFAELPPGARDAAQDCKERVEAILTDTRREGFSTTAIAWSMIGAISNITNQMFAAQMKPRHARRQHEKIVKSMIAALNSARRSAIH